jgi:hypothetical protein
MKHVYVSQKFSLGKMLVFIVTIVLFSDQVIYTGDDRGRSKSVQFMIDCKNRENNHKNKSRSVSPVYIKPTTFISKNRINQLIDSIEQLQNNQITSIIDRTQKYGQTVMDRDSLVYNLSSLLIEQKQMLVSTEGAIDQEKFKKITHLIHYNLFKYSLSGYRVESITDSSEFKKLQQTCHSEN